MLDSLKHLELKSAMGETYNCIITLDDDNDGGCPIASLYQPVLLKPQWPGCYKKDTAFAIFHWDKTDKLKSGLHTS